MGIFFVLYTNEQIMEAKSDDILINDWHVVARSPELKPGDVKQVRLLGENIVIWRANSPEAQAFAWQEWKLQKIV